MLGVHPFRFAHRVFPSEEIPVLMKEGDEVVLRRTFGGVQQIKAKFLEDDRRITHLWFQRWDTSRTMPIGEQFTLTGSEIDRLIEFLISIDKLHIETDGTFNGDYSDLRLVRLDSDAQKTLEENPDLVAEFARSKITTEDIIALAYRRSQLGKFNELLQQTSVSEDEWQAFFEKNQWIFGYGLAYVFTTSLDGRSLQQTVRGNSILHSGKRPDGLLRTRAAISALCLVEIKRNDTALLKTNQYRAGTWAPSAELVGAIAQAQENVRSALDEIGLMHQFEDNEGNPTAEILMAVQPRSFLVIGNLSEFHSTEGINKRKFQSFEDFRRNLRQPEILTFDELYERAKFIVASADSKHQEDIPIDSPF
jgi:hypothetical protein